MPRAMKRHKVLLVLPALSLTSWGTLGKSPALISPSVKQEWNLLLLRLASEKRCTASSNYGDQNDMPLPIWNRYRSGSIIPQKIFVWISLIHWPDLKRNRNLELESRWVLSPLLLFNLAGMSFFSFKMNEPCADSNSLNFCFQTKIDGILGDFLFKKNNTFLIVCSAAVLKNSG